MKSPRFFIALFFAFLAIAPASLRAAVVWSGNGTPNASGTWETANNWNPVGVPGPPDSVQLDNVTSGTRTVTISDGSPQTISQLAITQTTVGAVNRLLVNDNLTISAGAAAPLTITPTAGAASVVIDIAAGKTFEATRTNGGTFNNGGTLNLLGAGATYKQSSIGNITANFSGSITAAAGSELRTTGAGATPSTNAGATLNFSGASSFGTGSEIVLEYTAAGSAIFTNSGVFAMDNAKFTWYWNNSTTGGNNRNYHNTGTWTLANGSSVVIETTNGQGTGGFNTLQNNTNSGTLNVESGSILTSRTITNTGTINLGSSTGGVSDATVTLGYLIDNNIELTNGTTSTAGTVNILGNALFGRFTSSSITTAAALFRNGTDGATGSVLDIGDGTTPITFTISHNHAELNNFAGNTINLKSNTTLLLTSAYAATGTGNVTLTNAGSFIQQGTIQFRSNASAGTRIFSTTGSHMISGTGAVIESLANSGGGTATAIAYTNSGQLSGATANDKLTYTNNSGNAAVNTLTLGITGEITPGNGSNGSGVSSIGALSLENINVTLSGAAKLTFDIGGTAGSGLFDTLALTGSGASFALGINGILDIRTVNGATPFGTYLILSATSVTGTFDSLLYNGAVVSGQYTVDYLGNGIQLNFAAIPEPSAGLLLLSGVGILAWLRRRR